MARFTVALVEDVIPTRKVRRPAHRALIREQYREALHGAIVDRHEALVVELEPDDKVLTIRNRLQRAADSLGLEDVSIRRRGNRVIAYQRDEEDSQ